MSKCPPGLSYVLPFTYESNYCKAQGRCHLIEGYIKCAASFLDPSSSTPSLVDSIELCDFYDATAELDPCAFDPPDTVPDVKFGSPAYICVEYGARFIRTFLHDRMIHRGVYDYKSSTFSPTYRQRFYHDNQGSIQNPVLLWSDEESKLQFLCFRCNMKLPKTPEQSLYTMILGFSKPFKEQCFAYVVGDHGPDYSKVWYFIHPELQPRPPAELPRPQE